MSTSAMRQGSSGKGDGFRGSVTDYRSGYNNINWGRKTCVTCGKEMSKLADGTHLCTKCIQPVEIK